MDIAVFSSSTRTDGSLFMVVECKQRSRKGGLDQLKLYLDMSAAEIGVWFNGDDHEYLRKVHHKDGSRKYTALPNIPRYGQRIEDIGLFTRQDLKMPSWWDSVTDYPSTTSLIRSCPSTVTNTGR